MAPQDVVQDSDQNPKSAFFAAAGLVSAISPSSFYIGWGAFGTKDLPKDITLFGCVLAGFLIALLIFVVSGHVKQSVFVEVFRVVVDKIPNMGNRGGG